MISVLALIQGVITLIDGIRAARHMRSARQPTAGGTHRVVVFCPCKGIEPEFEKNIRSILEQEYGNFSVWFIVESEEDPAFRTLREMGVARILVAGGAFDCGQKVHNLSYAVEHTPKDADIYVFCDSDARFPRHWLRDLIAPLSRPGVAVATGYRWYVVSRLNIPTLLRSAWNASVVTMLGAHGRNFAWGGSMALRRETFDRLAVLDHWRGAVSDDYAVTRAIRKAGERIVFVPTCLVPSYGDCGFRELLVFTTRQILITRIYQPRLWWNGLLSQTVFNVAFIGLILGFRANAGGVPMILWLALYFLAATKATIRLKAVSAVVQNAGLARFGWCYVLSVPVVALLFQYNIIRSALTRKIVWRQIGYELLSPNETRILRRPTERIL